MRIIKSLTRFSEILYVAIMVVGYGSLLAGALGFVDARAVTHIALIGTGIGIAVMAAFGVLANWSLKHRH